MREEEKIKKLENELEELRSKFNKYVSEKQKEDQQKLRTALIAAGGIILALGSFIWMEIVWPVVKSGRGQ